MVARTASNQRIKDIKYFGWEVCEQVTFTTNDTYTASDFVDTENLKYAAIIKNLDGSELTNTVLNNVVTCTSAGVTDAECTIFLFGVRS